MARDTLFKCDRCGDEWRTDRETKKRLLRVRLFVDYSFDPAPPGIFDTGRACADWCQTCVDAVDLFERKKPAEGAPPPLTPSERIEEVLREIAREEATAVVQESQR